MKKGYLPKRGKNNFYFKNNLYLFQEIFIIFKKFQPNSKNLRRR